MKSSRNSLRCLVLGGTLMLSWEIANAALELAPLFRDHAVLQRNRPVPIWGRATPGAAITLDFAGQEMTTTAGPAGDWRVTLKALPASGESRALQVVARAPGLAPETNRCVDVLVGDVWLCAGQSNMERSVSQAQNATEEIDSADFPRVRHIAIRNTLADQPAFDVATSGWESTSPATVRHFTAVGYFFAREIHRQTGVPIGIVHCSFGGTRIEAWMSGGNPAFASIVEQWRHDNIVPYAERKAAYDAALAGWQRDEAAATAQGGEAHARFIHEHKRPAAPVTPQQAPSVLFNGMVHPLVPYALRGILWYQGESNVWAAPAYRWEFPALIEGWRQQFGRDDLPFYWVQLAGYESSHDWPALREAQSLALALPNTGQAVAIDVGDAGDIHPRDKQAVGHRLALIARALTYGEKVEYVGPVLRGAERHGASWRLEFAHAEGGLVARGGAVQGLEMAGADHVFHPAFAQIDGTALIVSSPDVPEPLAVRYAWRSMPEANLYNGADLPAAPFRTDAW
jgi:sialate O-acetylesterase